MATYDKAIESCKKAVTTAVSLVASAMLVRGVVNELVPYEATRCGTCSSPDWATCGDACRCITHW